MKVAFVSDDGMHISPHFGRATLYVVFTVEEGRVVGKEVRPKPGHRDFTGEPDAHGVGRHGYGPGAEERHERMFRPISDCDYLVAGGMGWGAYEGLRAKGIKPIVTDVEEIEEAISLLLEGRLKNLMERVH